MGILLRIAQVISGLWLRLSLKPWSIKDVVFAASMVGFLLERTKNALTECKCTSVDDILGDKYKNCSDIHDRSNL